MTIIYHEDHGDLEHLRHSTIAVIGYGNLGRPLALNMRDSGVRVMVSEHDEQRYRQAIREGFELQPIEIAVQQSAIVVLTLPDEAMAEVYLTSISPHLHKGHSLIFASAYNVTFGFIEPPPFVDVGLVAPRTIGAAVRERYENGQGFVSFVAVAQDATGAAWQTVLACAKAMGSLRAGAIEIGFEQEAHLDLFLQQGILPVFHHLIITSANILMNIGYPPEAVLMDLYLSGEFTDYLMRAARDGLMKALRLTSLTSQYGTLSRMDRFNDLKLERLMEVTMDEIRNGDFAQEWAREYEDGYRRLKNLLKRQEDTDLWEWEQQALDMLYPFRNEEIDDDELNALDDDNLS
ncbi:MAG: ketol-acid reductoisomerase [Chloroflexi bacterium]|nr:MAG: ketol-acid reductoisomerase [Phototrophicales bacterium]RMF81380.1 MAG: ketol-acid reductoisomerase [Chloroflexota bacterium]